MQNKTQEERLDYLLNEFMKESVNYRNLRVGESYTEKRMALRALMNIRMPGPMQEDVLKVQDEFLSEEAKEKGIVTLEDIPSVREMYGGFCADKLSLWQGDITRLRVDVIVNAANSQMLGCFVPCHGCIDNAIHSAAGIQLREECSRYMEERRKQYGTGYEEPTGQAILTKGYNLPATYIIHTVGPIVRHCLTDELRKELENCYKNVLKCCVENKIRSVAFCCISTGEFHFPNDEAARIALKTVMEFLAENQSIDRVVFNVFKDEDKKIYERELKREGF